MEINIPKPITTSATYNDIRFTFDAPCFMATDEEGEQTLYFGKSLDDYDFCIPLGTTDQFEAELNGQALYGQVVGYIRSCIAGMTVDLG